MPEPVTRKHPAAECEKCPLNEQGLFVASDGPAQARVAFIGEAAGRNEVQEGKPFIGMSGKLLDMVNKHHGINRKDVLLTNATLCRPPGKENLAPPQGAVKACRPRLLHELEERGVRTAVALGNTAAQTLLGSSEGVTKLRVGLGKKSPYLDALRVIPTFHPAACLRSADFFPSMVTDIGKIKRQPVTWVPPKYVVYDDPKTSIAALEQIKNHTGRRLVIDIETDVEKEDSYDHPNNYELLCIGLGFDKKRVVVIERNALKDKDVLSKLKELLASKDVTAQNGKFDASGLYPHVGDVRISFDTMLASYARDERRGVHSLDYQSIELLGTPDWKSALDKYNPKKLGYGVIPPDVLDEYNAFDVSNTWDLQDWYEEHFTEDQRKLHDFLCAAQNELKFLDLNGIAIDIPYNTQLMTEYLDVLEEIKEHLIKLIDDPEWADFNPNSPKQVKEVIEEVFNVSIPLKRNQKGQPAKSTDADTLQGLAEKQDPESREFDFFDAMLDWRENAKLYGTYVKGIRRRIYRGRVYPNFILHGTTTGRLACRNPNLQNVPRGNRIRAQFVPAKEGNVFVSCLVPGTRLLMKDLTWKPVEDIQVGEELVGFNQDDVAEVRYTKATATSKVTKDCYKITLDDGTQFVCSGEHKWVVSLHGTTNSKWRTTEQLWRSVNGFNSGPKAKEHSITFKKLVDPWEVDHSREAGYIAGFLDGEGSLTGADARGTRITFGQNPGPVADYICKLLHDKGFPTAEYTQGGRKCLNHYLSGDNRPALRAVGMFRPMRFLAAADQMLLGRRKYRKVQLVSIEHVGPREVVALETDEHTFFAEGFASHNCDYSQAELRVLTWLAQEEYFRNIFNDSSRDLFDELAPVLYGDISHLSPAEKKEKRIRVKAYVYGLSYGREAGSIAHEFKISFGEAQQGMDAFFGVIPGVVAYQQSVAKQIKEKRDLETPFGRHRRFHLITPGNWNDCLKEGLAFRPQSISSDLCLRAFTRARPYLKGKAHLRNIVHDSLLAECREEDAEEVGKVLNDLMVESAYELVGDYVRFATDTTIGPDWGSV